MRNLNDDLPLILPEPEPKVDSAGGALRLVWRFGKTTITQRLTIYRNSPRIDFRTELDWQERQVVLKAAFPVNVRATHATYDIQFGSLERPTHWNTPSDMAHYENPAQKWVDFSEGNYGVALLNDCKYGYDVKDNLLRTPSRRRCPFWRAHTCPGGRCRGSPQGFIDFSSRSLRALRFKQLL